MLERLAGASVATQGIREVARAQAGQSRPGVLVATLVFVALVVAAIGSLGAPLITSVARTYQVSLAAAQWTLTITLLTGAVAIPLLGRLGDGPRRRATVVGTLAAVVAGGLATVVPGPFWVLLAGRAAQGTGLGLTALMIATAREHLAERAGRTIALLSVASTAGIGVGYPLAGLLTEVAGVRAAYALGLAVTAAALAAALLALPTDDPARAARPVDWTGAGLLGGGLVAVLLVTGDTDLWMTHPPVAPAVLAAGVLILAAWVVTERRTPSPLVDLTALRHPAVAGANLVMGVSGVGMYLLLTLITRYAQTPPGAGYGYGLSTFQAGLVLVPFSVLGFVAGRVGPRVGRRVGPFGLLVASGGVVGAAFMIFAAARGALAGSVVAMAVLGFGVGGFSAAMPQAILAVTPVTETASAMGLNQVVRAVGFSTGSAVGGLILAASTAAGGLLPTDRGYTTAAGAGVAVTALGIGIAAATGALQRRRADRRPDP
jgi:predicted MFS family arabinose efflux permease